MTKIDSLIRKIKKEHLLLERKKKEQFASRDSKLRDILSDDEIWSFESCVSHAMWNQIISDSNNAGSLIFQERNPKRLLKLTSGQENLELLAADVLRLADKNEIVYVYPLDWDIFGSYLVSLHALFSNIDRFSFLVEDSFEMIDLGLDSILQLEIERGLENSVTKVRINVVGHKFDKYIHGLKHMPDKLN
ncbi:MAG: hypothetical protein ABJN65_08005 [Parasphingorhabdus sp.]